jgi:hypothetical protein
MNRTPPCYYRAADHDQHLSMLTIGTLVDGDTNVDGWPADVGLVRAASE